MFLEAECDGQRWHSTRAGWGIWESLRVSAQEGFAKDGIHKSQGSQGFGSQRLHSSMAWLLFTKPRPKSESEPTKKNSFYAFLTFCI